MEEAPFQWFAMRATYKREFIAREYLVGKGFEVFLPLKKEVREIRGIKRKVTVPAISSLVFVKAQKEKLQQAKYGVEYLQYLTGKLDGNNVPIVVPEDQMELFRMIVEDDTIDKTYFTAGEINLAEGKKVKVHGGVLDGYKGVLVKVKGKRNKQFFLEIKGILSLHLALKDYHLIEVIE